MNPLSIVRVTLAGIVSLLLGAAHTRGSRAGFTVTPTSHDFGKEIVGKTAGNPEQFFVIQLPPGATAQNVIGINVIDPTQQDFKVDEGPSWRPAPPGGGPAMPYFGCNDGSISSALATPGLMQPTSVPLPAAGTPGGVGTCYLRVWFQPTSVGPKKGEIQLYDPSSGSVVHLTLTGIGEVGCVYTVVQGCNYAPMYYGSFNWTYTSTSPTSSYAEDANVDVLWGVATCNVTAKRTEDGQTRVGTVVAGKGLIAVEFPDGVDDSTGTPPGLTYRITVACPSPAFPATADAPATPSRPADLGDSQETYEQRVQSVGRDLIGTISQPNPESDPTSGIGGRLELHWSLKRP